MKESGVSFPPNLVLVMNLRNLIRASRNRGRRLLLAVRPPALSPKIGGNGGPPSILIGLSFLVPFGLFSLLDVPAWTHHFVATRFWLVRQIDSGGALPSESGAGRCQRNVPMRRLWH